MVAAACSDMEFMELFRKFGATEAARKLGVTERNVYERRRSIEKKTGVVLAPPTGGSRVIHPERATFEIENGNVIAFSDAHYWPDIVSTAHRALVKFCKELKPKAIIANGDMFDGAKISRHAAIGWEDKPSVIQEIEAVQERLGEVIDAAPKAKRFWPLGNHDARFESRLANVAPEYAKLHGMHLKDHVPWFEPCWSLWINQDVVAKHRWKGGTHAGHNNTLGSGRTMITGHDHYLGVTPYSDYNGTRWGVRTGTLAEPYGPQFVDYTEDAPRNHRSGFAVLTWHKGELLWPELVHVRSEGEVEFRGQVHAV